MTVAVNGLPLFWAGATDAVNPLMQGLCAFAIGRVRRRVETVANTVEILILILSCLGRIGSGDRIHVVVRWWDYFFGLGGIAAARTKSRFLRFAAE